MFINFFFSCVVAFFAAYAVLLYLKAQGHQIHTGILGSNGDGNDVIVVGHQCICIYHTCLDLK